MAVGSTYYITHLAAKRVAESIVPSGVEFPSWYAMTSLYSAPERLHLKSLRAAEDLSLQEIAKVPIGSIVSARGMVTSISKLDESSRMRKVVLTQDTKRADGAHDAVTLCLWRHHAEQFEDSLLGYTIVISCVRTAEFKDHLQLSSTGCTVWHKVGGAPENSEQHAVTL